MKFDKIVCLRTAKISYIRIKDLKRIRQVEATDREEVTHFWNKIWT